jgi:hypothetical protein
LISDILIDQESSDIFLTVQNADGTKARVPLKSSDFEVDIGEEAINKIRLILDRWGEKRKPIAEFYLTEKREIDSFFYDLLALAHFSSLLQVDHDHLLGRWNPPDLLHDRVIAQLLHGLSSMGYQVETKIKSTLGKRSHDFNASIFRCEVKSLRIQVDTSLTPGGVWLERASRDGIAGKMRQESFNAMKQVGRDGIVFMTPLSPNLNSLFRGYFKDRILNHVPPLQTGSVILVLSTQSPFRDCYLIFPRVHFLAAIEKAISDSHAFGLDRFRCFIDGVLDVQLRLLRVRLSISHCAEISLTVWRMNYLSTFQPSFVSPRSSLSSAFQHELDGRRWPRIFTMSFGK